MEQEIKDVIAKNLPAQVGEVLKTRLEQAERDALAIKSLEAVIDKLRSEQRLQENRIREYKLNDDRNSTLEMREKVVAVTERVLAIKTLEYQLQSEKDKTKFVQDVSMGLVRNIDYRKNVYDSVSRPVTNQYGGIDYQSETHTTNEDKSAD